MTVPCDSHGRVQEQNINTLADEMCSPVVYPHPADDDVDLDVQETLQEPPRANCYARFLARFPYIIPILIVVIVGAIVGVCYKFYPPPDFSEPVKGFETRGTPIMACSSAHEKLNRAIYNHELSPVPIKSNPLIPDKPPPKQEIPDRGKRSTYTEYGCPYIDNIHNVQSGDRIILQSGSDSNMFTVEGLRAICNFEKDYITSYLTEKCPMPHIANYISYMLLIKCADINQHQLDKVTNILQECSAKYDGEHMNCTNGSSPCDLSDNCHDGGPAHQIFYVFADADFVKSVRDGKPYLKYAAIALTRSLHISRKDYFTDVLQTLPSGQVKLAGVSFGDNIRFSLFSDYLISDIKFFILAMGLVLLVMLFYLRSFALMVATVLNVGFSFMIAYFLYFFVLRMTFFPFMNILAMLLLIAVGADDVFIFYDSWQQAKHENPTWSYEHWIAQTFHHAALSILVTSLTTGAAFFSNMVSSITAIRCFGLFAGVAIMANLLLMITWTPAVIVLVEKITEFFLKKCPSFRGKVKNLGAKCTSASGRIFGSWVPTVIEKGRFIWIFLLLGIGIGGFIIVFYKPGLSLPKEADFQLFPNSNPMERWDRVLKYNFQASIDAEEKKKGDLTGMITWGIKGSDNGNWLDPDSHGTLVFDPNFKAFTPAAQLALEKFCKDLKNQTFINDSYKNRMCLFEGIELYVKYVCGSSSMDPAVKEVCCRRLTVPFDEKQIKECLIPGLARAGGQLLSLALIFPIFDRENTIKAFMTRFQTKYSLTPSFEEMDKIYKEINGFVERQKESMPKELKGMCFSGNGFEFRFYDLQRALSQGTFQSIGLSLGVAGAIMLLTSRNFLVTFYAIVTIMLAIAVTVGTIVLLGWELNIMESIAVSLSVGLSIDFTIHYGVAYRISKETDRKNRVREAFWRVGFAVAVAALTTFLAGAAVMPSHILAYIKLGIFLMLVMSYSWVYATFFFQSLCCVLGPNGNFCQVPSPLQLCRRKRSEGEVSMETVTNGGSMYLYSDVEMLIP